MAIQVQSRFFTFPLTEALILVRSMNICNAVSILVVSGTLSVQGDMDLTPSMPSTPITLSAGQVINLPATSGAPIDGVTLTPTGGTTNLLICF